MQRSTPLAKLWNFFTRKSASGDSALQGSRFSSNGIVGNAFRRSLDLEVLERPVRPICGSLDIANEICEMKTWSYEVRHAVSIIARDCFQAVDGRVASWRVADKLDDGTPVNEEVLLIGRSLATRMNGKKMVLGGDRLQRAAREILWAGDSFIELEFNKDTDGSWYISDALYLPTLNTFVEEDEHGKLKGYWQRKSVHPREDDIFILPIKCLHFRYEEHGSYGMPLVFQSLEMWRKIKEVSADIEDVARSAVGPWLHIMPAEWDESKRNAYRQEIEQLRADGIIRDLYLLHGADLKKATNGDSKLTDLLEYWLKLRYQMVPPQMPLWLFPGLSTEDKAGKDLAGQPALAYARLINSIRAIVGEQIKFALNIEIILKKGYDWWEENAKDKFDIAWGEWAINPNQKQETPGEDIEDAPGEDEELADDSTDEETNRLIREVNAICKDPDKSDVVAIEVLEKWLNLRSKLVEQRIIDGWIQPALDKLRVSRTKLR